MQTLVNNKIVSIEAVKQALHQEFSTCNFDSKEDASNAIDEFIQQKIEIPAAEQAGLEHTSADIYEIIDNVDDLRDLQNEFVNEVFHD